MAAINLIIATVLTAAPQLLNFDCLPSEQDERAVQLRGFAYQTAEGRWILSADPLLKSCCVGSPAKAKQQVVLEGEFVSLPKAQAIIVEGRLRIHPTQDLGYYSMHNAAIVDHGGARPWYTLIFAMGVLLLWGGYKVLSNKTQHK